MKQKLFQLDGSIYNTSVTKEPLSRKKLVITVDDDDESEYHPILTEPLFSFTASRTH